MEKTNHYIQHPEELSDFVNNVQFQLYNIKGYLSIEDYESALIKAKYLVEALQKVVAKQSEIK